MLAILGRCAEAAGSHPKPSVLEWSPQFKRGKILARSGSACSMITVRLTWLVWVKSLASGYSYGPGNAPDRVYSSQPARRAAWVTCGRPFEPLWKKASVLATDGTYPLRLDEPLWRLRRQGCRKIPTWPCAYRERCSVVAYCQPDRMRLSVAGDPNQQHSEWNSTIDSPRLSGA